MTDKLITWVILINGLEWLQSSYGKLSGGTFVGSLGGTLGKFAGNNPYPLVKSFLENVAVPNSIVFGQLTMWGETYVAVSLTVISLWLLISGSFSKLLTGLLGLGLLGGILLNIVFYLAAGWTSPSTAGVNLMMGGVQTVALCFVIRLWQSA